MISISSSPAASSRTERVIDNGYVAIRDGRWSASAKARRRRRANATISASAYRAARARSTAQVHSRSQKDQEDFIWSTRAAAAGGVTTIVDMPYDAGFLVCTGERVKQKIAEAGTQARVDFALYATDRSG